MGNEDFIGASGRLAATFDILRRVRATGERALVFIESRQMQYRFIELVKAEFGLLSIDLINGSTPIQKRQAIVNRFQAHLDRGAGFDLLVPGLDAVADDAKGIIATFDRSFEQGGKNGLKAIRDMIEHFDDYAAGVGCGPATREGELDPWRTVTPDRFERGRYALDRAVAYDAAIQLRTDAKRVGDKFIAWIWGSRGEDDPRHASRSRDP